MPTSQPRHLTEPVELLPVDLAPNALGALITLGILDFLQNKATFASLGGSGTAARTSVASSEGRTPI